MSDTVVIPANRGEGASFGKYQVISELGEGAMGKVYKCYDPDFQRMVAVKTVHKALLDSSPSCEFRERFRNEMRAAGKLSHPNIVAVFDAGEKDGCPFFVMEFVEGQELRHMLDEATPFTIDQSLSIIKGVLSGLARIHQNGITHRDLKPANIFIASDGVAKIADFGIAKLDSSEMTQVGTIIGSPKYMSPEQCVGEPADARSDLFAVGIILYELLTGTYCFSADSTTAITQKIINVNASPPSRVLSGLPKNLDGVIKKALAKKTVDRFQSADEFLAALELGSKRKMSSGSGLWLKLGGALSAAVVVLVVGFMTLSEPTKKLGGSASVVSEKTTSSKQILLPKVADSASKNDVIQHLSPEKSAKVTKLFKVAETYNRIGRLVSPPGSNAYDAYKIILSIDPDNVEALQGIEAVEQALIESVNKHVESGDDERALLTAKAGREVFPDALIFSELIKTIERR